MPENDPTGPGGPFNNVVVTVVDCADHGPIGIKMLRKDGLIGLAGTKPGPAMMLSASCLRGGWRNR
jgi:hypothetical protein